MNSKNNSLLPNISVIIPAYNARKTIKACVDSIQQQTYPRDEYEIIVVDNGSTDGTDQVALNAGALVVYERDAKTSYAARNRGIRQSRGDIVVFIDSDCTAEPDWLKHMIHPFADPKIAGVIGVIRNDKAENIIEEFFNIIDPFKRIHIGSLVSTLTGNAAFQMALINRIGLFDETLPTSGDVDIGWRIQLVENQQIAVSEQSIVNHKHRNTISGLFKQFKRYGYSEILLTTLYRHRRITGFTPAEQIKQIFKQMGSLLIYLAAFLKRVIKRIFHNMEPFEFWKPMLLFVAESANILGKIKALADTHMMQRNPFPSRPEIRR